MCLLLFAYPLTTLQFTFHLFGVFIFYVSWEFNECSLYLIFSFLFTHLMLSLSIFNPKKFPVCLFHTSKGLKKKHSIHVSAFYVVFFRFMVGFWCVSLAKVCRLLFLLFCRYRLLCSQLMGWNPSLSVFWLDTCTPFVKWLLIAERWGNLFHPAWSLLFLCPPSYQHHSRGLPFLYITSTPWRRWIPGQTLRVPHASASFATDSIAKNTDSSFFLLYHLGSFWVS